MSSELIVASRNLHKIEEIREMLPGWRVRGVEAIPEAPEVEETGATFQENAALKALALSSLTEALVLADDSGLEVDALGGEPGVHSARYAGRHGDDAGNNAKLLRELRGVPGDERRARFRCAIVLARGGVELARFDGA
ncbi:MAG: non-canonical purine NTP pyrophosphatase, partial [Verrucomicrobiales bacterium]